MYIIISYLWLGALWWFKLSGLVSAIFAMIEIIYIIDLFAIVAMFAMVRARSDPPPSQFESTASPHSYFPLLVNTHYNQHSKLAVSYPQVNGEPGCIKCSKTRGLAF